MSFLYFVSFDIILFKFCQSEFELLYILITTVFDILFCYEFPRIIILLEFKEIFVNRWRFMQQILYFNMFYWNTVDQCLVMFMFLHEGNTTATTTKGLPTIPAKHATLAGITCIIMGVIFCFVFFLRKIC